jgi:fumarylacetoacetate (FAA) hydrolase
MKFATRANGHPDGELLVVSRDLTRASIARAASTLQAALDRWDELEPQLVDEYRLLNTGPQAGFSLDPAQLLAVMPRAYQFLDASAFLAHNHILADAWGYERRTTADPPLMYQGLSHRFHGPSEAVSFRDERDEIDFEAEFGVITDAVPRGSSDEAALKHIKLLLVLNDWSLRAFGPTEMKGGFGFLHAKPPSSLSPFAVTPDELGDAWSDGRIRLRLTIHRNGQLFGTPDGGEMSYDFGRLVAHACTTRDLCAGTILGSGTVSNRDASSVGSGCIAERRALEKTAGHDPTTIYLTDGETIRLEAFGSDGVSLFGAIDQTVRSIRCG